ncbi:hypothetical protein BJH93_14585 [Kocuria polaris]|nr:hypothetical protein [Kocuria polaris]
MTVHSGTVPSDPGENERTMIQPMKKVDEREYRESGSDEEQSRWELIAWPAIWFVVVVLALTVFDVGWLFVLGWMLLGALVHLLLRMWKRRT